MTEHDDTAAAKGPVSTPSLFRVARRAGVARSTASAALNGKPGVSEATRAKVLAAAEELGFRPNAVARSLRRGPTHAVGVVIDARVYELESRLAKAFSTRYLLSLVEGLSLGGIPVFQVTLERIATLSDLPVTAIQIFSNTTDLKLTTDLPVGTPVIHSVTGLSHQGPTCEVQHDIALIVRDVMEHLTAERASRPALITRRNALSYDTRMASEYSAWCREHDLEPIVRESQGDADEMAQIATDLVQGEGVDAIFSLVAEAAAMIDALRSIGKEVPRDVLLVSLSEGAGEELTHPPGSALSLCGAECGKVVAAIFKDGIHTHQWPRSVTLPHKLIIRESSTRTPSK